MNKLHTTAKYLLFSGMLAGAYTLGTHQHLNWAELREKLQQQSDCLQITHKHSIVQSELFTPVQEQFHANKASLGSLLSAAGTVCFIGDSVTAGSENGGYPWYKPLANAFPELKTFKLAAGGATSKSLLEMSREHLPACDVYIFALGTNDVRYRDAQRGATTKEEYIGNLSGIVKRARELNAAAQFVFISPWCSIPEDPIPPISREQKEQLMSEYAEALNQYCTAEGFLYINPNEILSILIKHPVLRQHYLKDHIHPMHPDGCYLYSAAVWEEGNKTYPPVSEKPAGR